jgi:hypothetical protein
MNPSNAWSSYAIRLMISYLTRNIRVGFSIAAVVIL